MNRTDRYFCTWPECGRSYAKPSKLNEHYRSHTNDVYNKIKCIVLFTIFKFCRDVLYVKLRDVGRVSCERATCKDTNPVPT